MGVEKAKVPIVFDEKTEERKFRALMVGCSSEESKFDFILFVLIVEFCFNIV
jgi:hypothetical protein